MPVQAGPRWRITTELLMAQTGPGRLEAPIHPPWPRRLTSGLVYRFLSTVCINEGTVVASPDLYRFKHLPFGNPAKNQFRNLRQQGVCQNVIHIARAASHFRTAVCDFIDEFVAEGKPDTMGFTQASLNFGKFQIDDLLECLVA